VEPCCDACLVKSAAGQLQREAYKLLSDTLPLPNHLTWMYQRGFSREDCRQIRYVVETFYNLEPIFSVLSVVAWKWLLKQTGSDSLPAKSCTDFPRTIFPEPIDYAEIHKYPPHPFYRAIALWSEYCDKIQSDISEGSNWILFNTAVDFLRNRVEEIASRVSASTRPYSLTQDPSPHIIPIRQCLDDSCEVIVLTCALRRSFIKAEVAGRIKRIRMASD
jgi:hypothetical protein